MSMILIICSIWQLDLKCKVTDMCVQYSIKIVQYGYDIDCTMLHVCLMMVILC